MQSYVDYDAVLSILIKYYERVKNEKEKYHTLE